MFGIELALLFFDVLLVGEHAATWRKKLVAKAATMKEEGATDEEIKRAIRESIESHPDTKLIFGTLDRASKSKTVSRELVKTLEHQASKLPHKPTAKKKAAPKKATAKKPAAKKAVKRAAPKKAAAKMAAKK